MRPAVALAGIILVGASWGITQPLAKMAVSNGYRGLGIVFWQFALGVGVLGALVLLGRKPIPLTKPALFWYVLIALIGTILPNAASYEAARFLPSGILSILLSTVPMMAFPIALALGLDRFSTMRLTGLGCGLIGVLLIILPDTSLPDPAMIIWLPVAMIAPLFYAFEGNLVAKFGAAGLDPVQMLFGASVVGMVLVVPLALASGTFISPLPPYEIADFAVVASSVIHALTYAGYFWLVARAGPVFASQVGYLVTGFGVFWAKLLLGESYSGWVWAAMALMLLGVFLVQPRRQST